MNKERLDELEKLAEAATPGPWAQDVDTREGGSDQVLFADGHTVCFVAIDPDDEEFTHRNAAFIASARTAVPELLAALDERDKEIERLKANDEYLTQVVKDREASIERVNDCYTDMWHLKESELAALRARCAELEADNKSAVEKLAASVEAGATLMEEKNVFADRCEKLEKVREAAEKVIHDEIHGSISREIWAAFKAALSAARGQP